MRGLDKGIGLLVAVVLAIALFVGFTMGPLLNNIVQGTTKLGFRAEMAAINSPGATMSLAMYANPETRETAVDLKEMAAKEPWELAIDPRTTEMTQEKIESVKDVITGNSQVSSTFLPLIFQKCGKWMLLKGEGAKSTFELDKNTYSQYYAGLDQGTLSPVTISQFLYENDGVIDVLCGEEGCPNTRTCAECWEVIEDYPDLDTEAQLAVEKTVITRGCGEVCAITCSEVYTKLYPLLAESGFSDDAEKRFIQEGLRLP